ncbi:hypothetical protein HC026_00020 [Lactobacillus sp. LC28-10]|uniref:Regulatory protein YycH domain-containing protein n=1 Tax=Secundilactobacillus angelensis TaxID=2722706 RepID=A0ABX1KTN5_9LACO|nr:hypothetical protein [Secundilactobacillus angelensis]MCH5461808.1 hypothetical protein [Secundilactobacillus angelensis]NLR17296.1 hypothetical protein [Secundilactobacillus angelensis]
MKLRNLWLPGSLTVAILISLGLSGMMWTNPAHSNISNRTKVTKNSDNSTNTTFQDIYLPSQLVSTSNSGKQALLTNSRVNVATDLRDRMSHFTAEKAETTTQGNSKKYLAQLKRKGTILMSYNSAISVDFFQKAFNNQIKIPNQKFNRLQIMFNDPNHLYLLNDHGYRVVRVTLKNYKASKLKNSSTNTMVKHPVSFKLFHGKIMLSSSKSVKLNTYSYQLTQQTADYYANRVMTTNSNSNVQIKRHANSTDYDDHGFRHMSVDKKTDTVNFTDYNSQVKGSSFLQTMNHVYEQLVMVGIPLNNVRFYSYDSGSDTAVFRTYVGGLPVFDQSDFGAIQMKVLDQSSYRMKFSLDSLQVPLPPVQSSATIMSTNDLLKQLKNAGIKESKIQDVQLGYEWSRDKSLSNAVNLSPTWYVEIGNQWQNYRSLVGQQ